MTSNGVTKTNQDILIKDDDGSNIENTLVIICFVLSASSDCLSPFSWRFGGCYCLHFVERGHVKGCE